MCRIVAITAGCNPAALKALHRFESYRIRHALLMFNGQHASLPKRTFGFDSQAVHQLMQVA